MARKGRIEFSGAVYHVLDRGNRREPIVHRDADRAAFVRTLGEACLRAGWRLHAFVLMTNHYHLLLETPEPNLVAGMRWFQTTWTVRFNRFHGLSGHLFQGRYKAILVDSQANGYLTTLSDYIHLNPVRAGLIGLEDKLFSYPWSSYPWYAALAGRPSWFEPGRVLGGLGWKDDKAGRHAYAERMRGRAVEERAGRETRPRAALSRGWCLGSESFRERVLRLWEAKNAERKAPEMDASLRLDHGKEQASQLLREGLSWWGLQEDELAGLKKSDPRKVALATLIRRKTTVPNQWIADALHLGHVSRVSRCWEQGNRLIGELEEALNAK
jgi:REP element-mobilizing transposase RayT